MSGVAGGRCVLCMSGVEWSVWRQVACSIRPIARRASVWRHTQRPLSARVETAWRQLNDQRLHAFTPRRHCLSLSRAASRHLAARAAGARDVTPSLSAAAAAQQ